MFKKGLKINENEVIQNNKKTSCIVLMWEIGINKEEWNEIRSMKEKVVKQNNSINKNLRRKAKKKGEEQSER